MLKLLQQQAQKYFSGRNSAELFAEQRSYKQKTHFYIMLILQHFNSVETAIHYLGEAANNKTLDSHSLLAAIWGVSLQVEPKGEDAKKILNLVSLVQARNIVDKSMMLADLPQWVTQGASLIEQSTYEKRIARVYTKINYEQSKYSLMRENNEGYAKLTLLLINLRDNHDITAVWKKIVSLVGNFDLDPDRVLDLVVEARLQNNSTRNYLKILTNFRRESITVILGNKLKLIKGKPIEASVYEKITYAGPVQNFDNSSPEQLFKEIGFVPNPYLITFIGQLIKANIITFNDMLPYLDPPDHIIRHLNSKRVDLALQKINKCFTLSMEEMEQAQKIKLTNEENIKFQGQLLHSTKFALIAELARQNSWTDFVQSWSGFKGKIDLLLYQPLLRYLLNLIEWSLDPVFTQTSPFHKFFKVSSRDVKVPEEANSKEFQKFAELNATTFKQFDELLSYVGPYLAFRPKLFIKICRILKNIAKAQPNPYDSEVKHIIKAYLVPGASYAQNNGPISFELFNLLQCYDYHFRYDCYLKVYTESMSCNPYVARIFESVKRRQNIIVNNLSKDNKKLFTRKVTKLTHNQALPVFYWIIRRIVMEDYEAVVPQIVSVLNNSTPMTLDIAIFSMLYTLNEHHEPSVNSKNRQFLPWFKNVITFISNFFRKYLQVDIQPIFDYILMKTSMPIQQLEDNGEVPGALLKLLHEIFNKMHGSVMIQDLDKKKMDLIAVGPRLQFEMLELASQVRAAKKSKIILQKFFWEQNVDHCGGLSLAFNLLVLLAQKRSEVLNKSFINDLKIISEIYDEYTLLIIQIVRILFYQAQDFNHYSLLLPKNAINMLLCQYKIPLQIACQIIRPGIKHIATMNTDEWAKTYTAFSKAYYEGIKDPAYLLKSTRQNEGVDKYLSSYKDRVQEMLPPSFFTAFWMLTLDSVYFPARSYSEKIDELKKKIDGLTQKKSERNEKEVERIRGLLEKIVKEEEIQRKKATDTLSEENLKKIQIEFLLKNEKNRDQKENTLHIFAQLFVQVCLLPRMMLDRAQAFYCVKFTIEMIKVNKMAATKSIRLLTFLIEYVMSYLPFTTQREAANCISIFLSEILAIFNNWNDSVKLKQDLKRILGIQETAGKDNYSKLKQYLVKLFERVGNTVRSIKEEPCIIKNCLYLLEKVDSIPSYKEQADELEQHMLALKVQYDTVDMRTILDRQIAILKTKRIELPDKPEDKKSAVKSTPQVPQTPSPEQKQPQNKPIAKQNAVSANKTPNIASRSPITLPTNTNSTNINNTNNANPNFNNSNNNYNNNRRDNGFNNQSRFAKNQDNKRDDRAMDEERYSKSRQNEGRFSNEKSVERRPKDRSDDFNRPREKEDQRNKQEPKRYQDNQYQLSNNQTPLAIPPPILASVPTVPPQVPAPIPIAISTSVAPVVIPATIPAVVPVPAATVPPVVATPEPSSRFSSQPKQTPQFKPLPEVKAPSEVKLPVPPLKTVKELKNQQKLQQQQKKEVPNTPSVGQIVIQPQSVQSDQKDSSVAAANPSMEETKKLTVETTLTSQKPLSSTNEKIPQSQSREADRGREKRMDQEPAQKQNNRDSNKQINERSSQVRWMERNQERTLQRNEKKGTPSISPDRPERRKGSEHRWRDKEPEKKEGDKKYEREREKDREREQRQRERERDKGKNLSYTYNRDRKSEQRRQQTRKQDKREKQRDNKDREKRHDKYHRSRSRDKYARR